MMKTKSYFIISLLAIALAFSPAISPAQSLASAANKSAVMTKDAQANLTSDAALEELMAGNKRFVANRPDKLDMPAQVKATTTGQYPKAVILSCIDSRVPVEMVFDQGIGDIFVARVAENTEDESILASMEYATAVAGSKLVMVLGHEACGAVKAGIDKFEAGDNVAHLLSTIEPAIEKVKGERDSSNKKYVEEVVKTNVQMTIDDIRERSPIMADLEKEGKIKIVGAYYNLHTGEVVLLD
ncbi:MAG: carbonic anhydrase family protein [Bacteroidales bacterium]|jgi:carbonic anhydrase|nr:carbonic anhydrase family protein [Bacteroidales bacterium]